MNLPIAARPLPQRFGFDGWQGIADWFVASRRNI